MTHSLPRIDPAMLAQAQHGDVRAHAAIYAACAPFVFTLARRMLASRVLAEDVLQATFVEVIQRIATFRGDAAFGFWIRRIAINQCLMLLRSPWSSRRAEKHDLADEPDVEPRHDERIALERALDCLPPTARTVVWLHDVEGFTHREIGRLLGHTASFSKSQLARAHERLRELLHETVEPEGGLEVCGTVSKIC